MKEATPSEAQPTTNTIRVNVREKTIELDQDLGVADGQEVEV